MIKIPKKHYDTKDIQIVLFSSDLKKKNPD